MFNSGGPFCNPPLSPFDVPASRRRTTIDNLLRSRFGSDSMQPE